MPRGYRSVIFAVVGWLSLAAAVPPNKSAKPDQPNATQSVSNSLNRIADAQAKQAETGEYEAPCADGEYKNQSDLCAQWYAARAARDAADWAYWAVFWTIVSLALSAVGLIALVVTIKQGREANQIARDTAKRQLRAYVHVKSADLCLCSTNKFPTNSAHAEQRFANVEIQNFGATPAYDVVSVFAVGIRPHPLVEPLEPIPEHINYAVTDLPPGRHSELPLEVFNSGPMHARMLAGGWAVYFWGKITYRDVFGETHRTDVSLCCAGSGYKRGVFQVAKEGNKAD